MSQGSAGVEKIPLSMGALGHQEEQDLLTSPTPAGVCHSAKNLHFISTGLRYGLITSCHQHCPLQSN